MNQTLALKDLSPEVKRIWLTRHEEPEPCEPFMVPEDRGVELQRLERIEQSEKIIEFAKRRLRERELNCFLCRIILEETFKEIGARYGFSATYAQDLYRKALIKLKSKFFPSSPDLYNYAHKPDRFPTLGFEGLSPEKPRPKVVKEWLPQNLPQDMRIHPNGFGWVANTANVSASAYVGPSAKVLGFAEVRDYAVIADHAIIKDHAIISGDAVVGGYATIRDSAHVHGERQENGSLVCTYKTGPLFMVFPGGIFQ